MVGNTHSICIPCRFTTKYHPGPCPHCGNKLTYMGKNFRPPRHNNKAQWKKIELAVKMFLDRRHHPDCFYGSTPGRNEVYFCRCPKFRELQTPADVKTGFGLRRSRKKNWTRPPTAKVRRPAGV